MRPSRTASIAAALLLLTAPAPIAAAQEGATGNSTARVRPDPGPVAARAGTAIGWLDSVDAALERARELDRRVFWYVPSVEGTFMDRQVEVDRYMLAGPFSWPRTIALLRESFVPVRQPATKELCERFGIERVEFIEPGYLVLSKDGDELYRVESLSTFHPRWFLQPLEGLAGRTPTDSDWPGMMDPSRLRAFPAGAELQRASEAGERPKRVPIDFAVGGGTAQAEALYLLGAEAHLAGNDAWGREIWQRLVADHPDHPLGAKAAMELEGHGPFLRGFEVYGPLAEDVLAQRGRGSQVAFALEEDEVRRAGMRFLVGLQNDEGGFEDSTYDFGGTDGLPNVYTAVTAIAGIALLDGGEHAAFELARNYCLDEDNLNPADTDEQIWAHLYRLRLLAVCMDADPEAKAWAAAPAQRIAQRLVGMQAEGGPWYHEYPNPFVTASCLVALADVARHGVAVDREVVERACDALERCRTEEGAWTYGMARRQARAAIEASVARGPLCELALVLWGRSSQERLLAAVRASFEHEDPLFRVRRYDDHTQFHAYGGFFFWYGLQGRAEAIAHLEDARARKKLAEMAREQVLALPEFDGCFVDSHEVGRAYGTGMALWTLRVLADHV